MKLAFSKPTQGADEQQLLFSRFRSFGYEGLQLKQGQFDAYIDEPEKFVEQLEKAAPATASGLITGGLLDASGIASLRRLFHFAQKVGSERIIFCHSQARQGLSSQAIQRFARILSDLGKEAQQHGVQLSLHHHYNQPVMYREDFALFFEATAGQAVKLTVDTAHLVKSGITDIPAILRDYRHVIDNIHCKDFADGEFKPLGQGNINFGPVFEALYQIGFTGWLCADEESDSDLLQAMQSSAKFLHSILYA